MICRRIHKTNWIGIFEIPFRFWMFIGVVEFKIVSFAGDRIFSAKPMWIPPLRKGCDRLSNIALITLTTLSRINSRVFASQLFFFNLVDFPWFTLLKNLFYPLFRTHKLENSKINQTCFFDIPVRLVKSARKITTKHIL